MKRTRLCDRVLPHYTKGEEIMNMVTHIVGGSLGVIYFGLCLLKAIPSGNGYAVFSSVIYGLSMVTLYTMSGIYHGLRTGTGKKVMQIMDHCTIYFLIAGTYTPIVLCSLRPQYPLIGWGLFVLQWGLGALAITLTAIDLKKYKMFSMFCYIGLGWSVIFFLPQALACMGALGFGLLLSGGIAYTVGAVLFGLGTKIPWMHSVFHIFVVLGTTLQFLSIFLSVL